MNALTQRISAIAGCAFLLVSLLAPASVRADAFVYHFTNVFSGIAPIGSAPWADALFEDVSLGTVRLTITNVGLTSPESQKEFYFNLNTNLNPTSLTFTQIGTYGTFTAPTISTGIDAFKADGDGKYDILYTFTPGAVPSSVFGAGEAVVFQIGGIATLTVNDFLYFSAPAGGNGPFLAAAHVQNTGGGGDSAWISPGEASTVPEPTTGLLISVGLLSWLCRRSVSKTASA